MPSKRCPRCYEEAVAEWVILESNVEEVVGTRVLACDHCGWDRRLKKRYSGSLEGLEATRWVKKEGLRPGIQETYTFAWIGGAKADQKPG